MFGNFDIKQAITLEEIEEYKDNQEFFKQHLISIEDIFNDKQNIVMDSKKIELFLNGVNLKTDLEDGIYKIYNKDNMFIGTGEIKNKGLKRDVIM